MMEQGKETEEVITKENRGTARWVCHWATGPVIACTPHMQLIKGLGNFLGTHVHIEMVETDEECKNCLNEGIV